MVTRGGMGHGACREWDRGAVRMVEAVRVGRGRARGTPCGRRELIRLVEDLVPSIEQRVR